MKLLILLLLTSCGYTHYITKGRMDCDKKMAIINKSEKLWKNDKLVEKVISDCSYYYDVAH